MSGFSLATFTIRLKPCALSRSVIPPFAMRRFFISLAFIFVTFAAHAQPAIPPNGLRNSPSGCYNTLWSTGQCGRQGGPARGSNSGLEGGSGYSGPWSPTRSTLVRLRPRPALERSRVFRDCGRLGLRDSQTSASGGISHIGDRRIRIRTTPKVLRLEPSRGGGVDSLKKNLERNHRDDGSNTQPREQR